LSKANKVTVKLEKPLRFTKIINDPVHGFIEIPQGLMLDLIDSAPFQRLRRIKQLGMSLAVYPGAVHSRFHHALGAMHLTRMAMDSLKRKGVAISEAEYEATLLAILMHDIGHGPFSHSLEYHIIRGMHHEEMSLAMMDYLNQQFEGKLSLAIEIFTGKYPRPFLHQLVSSQLDMDRMDYLIRDSFFTGVAEGVVGLDRIIKTLNVKDDKIVVDSKGIYSVEKFIVARRLMYWQVYLHHAALSADFMLGQILRRARYLYEHEVPFWLDDTLGYFLQHPIDAKNLSQEVIERFIRLDDNDVEFHIKKWEQGEDPVLRQLCHRLLNRKLLKIRLKNSAFGEKKVKKLRKKVQERLGLNEQEVDYLVLSGKVSNQAYHKASDEPILIRFKNGKVKDLAKASDMQNITALSAPVVKHYLCWPEN
jgi:HD superfamily phosphohydrolase